MIIIYVLLSTLLSELSLIYPRGGSSFFIPWEKQGPEVTQQWTKGWVNPLENMKLNVDLKNIRDGLRFNVVHEWNPKKHPSIQSLHAVKSCPNIPKHLCILQKFAVQRSAQQPPRTGTLMYMLTLYQPVPGLKKKVAVEFPHGAVPHLGYTVYANLKSTGMSSSSCPPSNQGYLPRYKPSFQWRSVVLIDHPNILTWMYIYTICHITSCWS